MGGVLTGQSQASLLVTAFLHVREPCTVSICQVFFFSLLGWWWEEEETNVNRGGHLHQGSFCLEETTDFIFITTKNLGSSLNDFSNECVQNALKCLWKSFYTPRNEMSSLSYISPSCPVRYPYFLLTLMYCIYFMYVFLDWFVWDTIRAVGWTQTWFLCRCCTQGSDKKKR